MDPVTEKLMEIMTNILGNEEQARLFSEDPTSYVESELSDADLEGVDYTAALTAAMEEAGVPAETQEAIATATAEATATATAEGGTYTLDDIAKLLSENVQVVYEDNDYITNNIDQSLDIHGEVHGDVYQANESNVANATAEGAVAGTDVSGVQTQTGDGIQVGGDNTGVANQGDNSGQQAGGDAYADNVTTGDGNQVASDYSTVGEGNISADGAYIDDSAVAFGAGDATDTTNEDYSVTDTYTEDIKDSFNVDSDYTDNDTVDIDSHISVDEGGYGHEPVYETHEHVDAHDDDYDAPEEPILK